MSENNGQNNDKRKRVIALVIELLVSAILAAVSLWLLPDEVAIQIDLSGAATNTASKYVAVLLPIALTVIGALLMYKDEERNRRSLVLYIIGILGYALNFVFSFCAVAL